MAGFGRLVRSINSRNLISVRSNSMNSYQNLPNKLIKSLEKDIMPQKPKKPTTSFFLYLQSVREKLRHQYPDMKLTEIVKKASSEWAVLDPAEKEQFQKKYKELVEIYFKDIQNYKNSITDDQKLLINEKKQEYMQHMDKLETKRKNHILGKPKKPYTAFFLYIEAMRSKKDPKDSTQNFIRSIKDDWKNASAEEKETYNVKAAKLMKQYLSDLEEWEMKMINLGHSDIVRRKILAKVKGTQDTKEK